jgi:hypothetical protein
VEQAPWGDWYLPHEMQQVVLGLRWRETLPQALEGEPGRRTARGWALAVDRIEPRLLQREWFPMDYMMIPSVLRSANEWLEEMATFESADPAERAAVEAERRRLQQRVDEFERAPYVGGRSSSDPWFLPHPTPWRKPARTLPDDDQLWDRFIETVLTTDDGRVLAGPGAAERVSGHVITAWNPYSVEQPPEVNAAANRKMLMALGSTKSVPCEGASPDGKWREWGLFVSGPDRSWMLRLGRFFDQWAIFELDDDEVRVLACSDGRVVRRGRRRGEGRALNAAPDLGG